MLRNYSLDRLGLPRRIATNGGELLAAPPRLIVTVAGKDVSVPLKGRPSFTAKKDWKVEFKGKSKAAGLRFDVTGVMEQDGLVDLHLTYGPDGKPVEVERLRLEWPVDDTVPNRMICIGMGNNYSTRKIGEIPPLRPGSGQAGDGVVWSTMDLGKVGSGMTVGNFYQQVWIGTEQRGFLWHADSDQGWVPRDDMPAHELVRDGKTVVLRNNLIAVLDSEFHMVDAIDTYPSEAMIAADCPHTWGTQVDHLGFMNPHWSMMHDGGSHMSGVAEWPEFRHWGMARADVEFVPYWRNESVVKQIAPGLIASLWKRPGSVVVALMNYGPDAADAQQARAADLTLDLKALGVPKDATGERLRIRELERNPVIDRRIYQLDWVKALPKVYGNEHEKRIGRHLHLRPEIAPTLDAATGALGGFEIGYHDQRDLVISWDDQPINDAAWKNLFDARMRPLALEWGLNDATAIPAAEAARLFPTEHKNVAVQAWKKPGSVLIRIANTGKDQQHVHLTPDLAALGLAVTPEELDQHFVNAYDLQAVRDIPRHETVTEGSLLTEYNQPIHIREDVWREQDKYGDIVFDAHQPLLTARVLAGGVRYLCVSKY